MENLISIVIITYNHERYIRQAVESVLKQKTSIPIEILIGDDASTDCTGEILDEMNQGNQFYIFHREKNMGASANIYNLLGHARGKYIAFLEGDDYWIDCEKLQKQYNFLQNHLEYIGCTHECLLVDENGIQLQKQSLEWISKRRKFSIKESKGFYLSGQIGTLMCRNIFQNNMEKYDVIYTAHPMISDRTIQMVLALEGTLYRMMEYMGAYRLISKHGKENATSKCFVQNIHSAYDNFILTCYLEEYAKKYMRYKKRIDFSYIKKLFYTSAVIQGLHRNSMEIRQDMKKILNYEGVKKWQYLLFLPRGIIHKVLQKLK